MSEAIKQQILAALSHPEADEGLFFTNLYYLHEEDERPQVEASEELILEAIKELLSEQKIRVDDSQEQLIFFRA